MSLGSQRREEDQGTDQDKDANSSFADRKQKEESSEITDSQVEQLRKDLEKERQRSADLSKRNLYLQSDYVNLQRQTERRIADAIDDSRIRYIVELISVKEDLERAMAAARATGQVSIIDGLGMLLSRVDGILRADEVERIAISTGGNFDPRLHEAVAYTEGNGKGDGIVVSVVGNGYTLRGKVIKPALVEVSRENKPAAVPGETKGENGLGIEGEAGGSDQDENDSRREKTAS